MAHWPGAADATAALFFGGSFAFVFFAFFGVFARPPAMAIVAGKRSAQGLAHPSREGSAGGAPLRLDCQEGGERPLTAGNLSC